jgi:hypothetical protein
MVKKVFLAAGLTIAMAGFTMTAAPTEAAACHSGCLKKAKAKYGGDLKKVFAYKKACKKAYRAHKKSGNKRLFKLGLFRRAA